MDLEGIHRCTVYRVYCMNHALHLILKFLTNLIFIIAGEDDLRVYNELT